MIQVKSGEAWILYAEQKQKEADDKAKLNETLCDDFAQEKVATFGMVSRCSPHRSDNPRFGQATFVVLSATERCTARPSRAATTLIA